MKGLCQLIDDCTGDRCSWELLVFLGKHPAARFNEKALAGALEARIGEAERSLRLLVDGGLVRTRTDDNGVSLYWLTEAEPTHGLLPLIASLDLHRRQLWRELLDVPGVGVA
ncbi:MAG: hypothetical protein V1737_04560 [Chloroflexota bacterium]